MTAVFGEKTGLCAFFLLSLGRLAIGLLKQLPFQTMKHFILHHQAAKLPYKTPFPEAVEYLPQVL